MSYATGLEVVAGGRLYNIVVDTEVGGLGGREGVVAFTFNCLGALYLQSSVSVTRPLTCNCLVLLKVTGKKLLEKGELQRRYTIIPLNKISAKTLDDRVVNAAKSLVREFFKIVFGGFVLGRIHFYNLGHGFSLSTCRLERTTSTQLCRWWAMKLTCVRPWSTSLAPHWCATPWTTPKKWPLIGR